MKLHVLVEGPSEEAWLRPWLRRFLPPHTCHIIPHQGKGKLARNFAVPVDEKQRGLLDQLPAKLRVYGRALNSSTDRVVVLVDADAQDCVDLKKRITDCVAACVPPPIVLVRIAVEESEAFFLGDTAAMKAAFGKLKTAKLNTYQQDSVCGTWEIFRDVIGVSVGSEDKVGWAETIAPHLSLDPKKNKSPSFRILCSGLKVLAGDMHAHQLRTGAKNSRKVH